ncbi:SCO family protein [Rubricoccus marinus]|uniref:Thioredoxin domain-containing protein n=1 Tax=Rubricoccus marinus TaxID=716817 RepID=A0A259TZN1_9BACT|nr:SCO family protein [Rubricoccus marinus]OZC03235.1 hypothetical protein BSZ36_09760 [Rubricoccus marinus]
MTRLRILFLTLMAVAITGGAEAQVMSTQPAPIEGQQPEGALPNRLQGGVGVIERLGDKVSPETQFVDSDGEIVRIGDLLNQGKPVVVSFVYYNCPMLCSLVLDGFADAMAESDLQPGEDYTALALSFDSRDTPALASGAKEKYVPLVDKPGAASGFHFWTGEEDAIEQFTSEAGFEFAWDAKTQEFAHNAVLVFLSPDGTVTRYLYGVMFPQRDFKLALVEAGQGTVGSTVDRILLTCYQFDPDARSYSLAILGVMKWGGGALMLALIGGLAFFWRREVQRQNADAPDPDFPAGATPAA